VVVEIFRSLFLKQCLTEYVHVLVVVTGCGLVGLKLQYIQALKNNKEKCNKLLLQYVQQDCLPVDIPINCYILAGI